MSTFVVSKIHINAMLMAGLRNRNLHSEIALSWPVGNGEERYLNDATVDEVGLMLLSENRRSVNYHYNKDEQVGTYRYFPYFGNLPVVNALKAIGCYEHLACEHPEWRRSEAAMFCEALRRWLIKELDGYDKAPWEIME